MTQSQGGMHAGGSLNSRDHPCFHSLAAHFHVAHLFFCAWHGETSSRTAQEASLGGILPSPPEVNGFAPLHTLGTD